MKKGNQLSTLVTQFRLKMAVCMYVCIFRVARVFAGLVVITVTVQFAAV